MRTCWRNFPELRVNGVCGAVFLGAAGDAANETAGEGTDAAAVVLFAEAAVYAVVREVEDAFRAAMAAAPPPPPPSE